MKALCLSAILVVASTALAQQSAAPYILSFDDGGSDVAFDILGLQPLAASTAKEKPKYKSAVTVTASQNTQMLRMFAESTQGVPTTPKKVVAHRITGGRLGGGQVAFALNEFLGINLPELNIDATKPATIGIEIDASDPTFLGFAQTTAVEKDKIKVRQKAWLPSSFRCKLDDLPTRNVSVVEPIEIDNVGDLDGDGRMDFVVADTVALTIPLEDSGPFREWFLFPDPAAPTKTLKVFYNDNNGLPVLQVTVDVELVAMGFADPFEGDDLAPGRKIRVLVAPKALVRVDSWASIVE